MTQQEAHILVVDDDPLTCRLIEYLLGSQDYEVKTTTDPQEAQRLIQRRMPDLVLLDVQLPKLDGLALMRRLKHEHQGLPIVMVTAKAEMRDRLAGLEGGADDYVVKPFEPAELLARVKAVLRRSKRVLVASTEQVLTEHGIKLDMQGLTVTTPEGEAVRLTPTEARILHKLMLNRNRVVSREELTEYAVGEGADTSGNHIDVYIGRLRRKLGDGAEAPRYIATVRGGGYRFHSTASAGARVPVMTGEGASTRLQN